MWGRRWPRIELSLEQRQELDGSQPARIDDPETDQTYVLVRADVYERMRAIIDGITRQAGCDDPEMDKYELYRKKT